MVEPSLSTTQLQGWILRMRGGDRNAWAELHGHVVRRVEFLIRKMLRDFPSVRASEELDDVLQNVVLRMRRSLEGFLPESVSKFFTFSAVLINRELVDLSRKLGKPMMRLDADNGSGFADPPAASSEDPSRSVALAELHERVAALPETERQAFDLLYYQGLDQQAAAEIMEVHVRTLQRYWLSARRRLGRSLASWRNSECEAEA